MLTSDANTSVVFAILAALLIGRKYKQYTRKHNPIEVSNTPVLLAYYTQDTTVLPLKKGMIGNMHYAAMATVNFTLPNEHTSSALLYRVELPFLANIHLLGIPKQAGGAQLNPTYGDSIMELVDLEGNYSQHFGLYCEKGMQTTTRYVLDPKAMVFTLDFCQSQNWEIVGNELYFVASSDMKHDPNDPTDMQDDIVQFVTEIRPALERPLSASQKAALTPYGEDRRTDLQCPLCKSVMKNEEHYFSCPKGHGILLDGNELQNVKKGSLHIPVNTASTVHHESIVCPSCGNTMSKVAYDGGTTMIDSCTHCPYRWLDAGEYKPTIK